MSLASPRKTSPLLILTVLALASACVLQPEWKRLARENDLALSWASDGEFPHLLLANRLAGSRLHIYIEGDGSPWIHDTRVAIDPTPLNPVMLRIMTGATHPAVYLGRPCYFGTSTQSPCDPRYWTFERYGRRVVRSMCAAANGIVQRTGASSVVLVAHSGGAAIALAMKRCTDRLHGIVTIAGNLDPAAWARHHGYSPLADLPELTAARVRNAGIEEKHLQCRNDAVVPVETTARYFAAHPGAMRTILDDCTHSEGWEDPLAAIAY